MIKIIICGFCGKMGGNVYEIAASDSDCEVVCGVDGRKPENAKVKVYSSFADIEEKADVIIDFSAPSVLKSELEWAEKTAARSCWQLRVIPNRI